MATFTTVPPSFQFAIDGASISPLMTSLSIFQSCSVDVPSIVIELFDAVNRSANAAAASAAAKKIAMAKIFFMVMVFSLEGE